MSSSTLSFLTLYAARLTLTLHKSPVTILTFTALMGTPSPMAIMKTPLLPRLLPDNVLTCRATSTNAVAYRLVHWSPSLRGPTNMLPGSRAIALQIAATLSYYVARNVRIDSESSKLLILSPHSDTISDLEDVLGASASDLPPTLYDFYLVALYHIHYLPPVSLNFQNATTTINGLTPNPTVSPISLAKPCRPLP